MARSTAYILVLIALAALGSLFGGASYLSWILPGGLPFGNALTAVGLIAGAAAALGLSTPRTVLRKLSVTALVLAIAWLPLSLLLAGNLALNFAGRSGDYWIWFSVVTIVLVLIALFWALGRQAFAGNRRSGS